jgi:hypothetical protein
MIELLLEYRNECNFLLLSHVIMHVFYSSTFFELLVLPKLGGQDRYQIENASHQAWLIS